MSYLTVSSKRRHGDEWVQVKCDGCGALGPRVEVTLQRRNVIPREVSALVRLVAGLADGPNPSGRRSSGPVDDLCRACAYEAAVDRLIADGDRADALDESPRPDPPGVRQHRAAADRRAHDRMVAGEDDAGEQVDPAEAEKIYRDYLHRTARERAIAADDYDRDHL